MRSVRVWGAVALAVSVAAAAAAEDVTIAYNLTENGQPKGTATQFVSSTAMRMSQVASTASEPCRSSQGQFAKCSGDNATDIIVEYASGRLISIDHKKKEYWETTRAEMEKQLAQVSAQMEEQQKKMQES